MALSRRAAAAALLPLISIISLAGCAPMSAASGSLPAQRRLPSPSMASRDKNVTVFAAGDIADCRQTSAARSMAARTADLIAHGLALDPGAVALALGDTVYPDGAAGEFTTCYTPTWGRFFDRTLAAPGNHEYHTAGADAYYAYFGQHAGPDRLGYYSTDIGSWHVLSLNSNIDGVLQDAQLKWIQFDLARRRPGCLLAFWHHPMFSSGKHGNNPRMQPVWDLLVAAHADIVLSGHDHDYERFAPQDGTARPDADHGPRQFVVGTGGAHLRDFGPTALNRAAYGSSDFGVLALTLSPGRFDWTFLPIEPNGLQDHGAANCHG